jgi:hypothetical protein
MRHGLSPVLCFSLVVAAVSACAGYTNGGIASPVEVGDSSAGNTTGSSGDAGGNVDGGIDGGDGGCAEFPQLMLATDHCSGSATATIDVSSAPQEPCAANFAYTSTGGIEQFLCSGTLVGPNDALVNGQCETSFPELNCTAPHIPGVITCAKTGGNCTINICLVDAGTCP